MNRLLRALWDRLLPPGGDVVVARPRGPHWLGYRPEPQRVGDAEPEPHDLGPYGHCWWWPPASRSWVLCHARNLQPGDLWLPYQAIADPSAKP